MAGELTEADVQKILKIIDESNFDEIRLEVGDFKIMARKRGAAPAPAVEAPMVRAAPPAPAAAKPAPAPAPAAAARPAAAAPTPAASDAVPAGHIAVRAPMVGTFYQAPSPGAAPFCKEGDRVKAADTVCLIEVMKLFNSIPAGVDGTIAKVLVNDTQLVDHHQVLILIRTDA